MNVKDELAREMRYQLSHSALPLGGGIITTSPTQEIINNTTYLTNNSSTVNSSSSAQAPQTGYDDTYVLCDSLYKEPATGNQTGSMTFDLTKLNNGRGLEGVVQVKLGTFTLPNIPRPLNRPLYHFYRGVYLHVPQFPTQQSVKITPTQQYHYKINIDNTNSIAVSAAPDDPNFYFSQPITNLERITFNFLMPSDFRAMTLLTDKLYVRPVLDFTNQFEIIDPNGSTQDIHPHNTDITPYEFALDDEPNNMTEVVVVFKDMISGDATTDMEINNPEGVMVTRILSPTRFEVGLNSTFVWTSTDMGPYNPYIIIAKNRVAIPLRFSCLRKNPTNYSTPVHI
jgi:hypothetical protein